MASERWLRSSLRNPEKPSCFVKLIETCPMQNLDLNGLDCTNHCLHQLLGLESDSEPGWERWQFMLQSSCSSSYRRPRYASKNVLRFANVRIHVCIFMCVCVCVCVCVYVRVYSPTLNKLVNRMLRSMVFCSTKFSANPT